MTRRWLVTGCSSGLGRALAEDLAASGEQVVVTARNTGTISDLASAYPQNVVIAALDVRDPQACTAAVAQARREFGGLDVVVNNAGYGQFGAVEEISDAELQAQFDTNLFGPWRLMREVLPMWREQGSGHAIFVSSLASSVALPGLAAYCASKAALDALADAINSDAGVFGIKATTLQLGGFATGYGTALREPERPVAAYAPIIDEILSGTRALAGNDEVTQPELFARLVRRVAEMEPPPQRLPFGSGIDDYLVPVMSMRFGEFSKAVADGQHRDAWLQP